METGTIISLAIAACALLFTALNFKRTSNQDTSEVATQRATITADIQYIRSGIDEIKVENKVIKTDIVDLKTKVVEIEQCAKSAHTRLDDLMRKEHLKDD